MHIANFYFIVPYICIWINQMEIWNNQGEKEWNTFASRVY
jgi:hypothetical protein